MSAVTAHRRVRWGGVGSVVAAAALLLAACGDGGSESVPTTATSAPTTTTTVATTTTMATTTTTLPAPRKVLILGDSTMVDAQPAMMAMFEATGATVTSGAGPGFGLTRLGLSTLPSPYPELFPRLVAEEQPDLVVVMVGSWDLAFIEAYGADAYVGVVDDAMSRLIVGGARVLWLSIPPGGGVDARVQNVPFQQARANHVGAVYYVDFAPALRGPDGGYPVSYVAADGSTVHLRKADGYHFCPDGAERVAAEVNARAVEFGLMRPAPDGWQQGAWRSAGVYDDPVCG